MEYMKKESIASHAPGFRGGPLNWNNLVRQIHRWLSIAFTGAVIFNGVAVAQNKYAGWMGLLVGLPLALLLLTGLYLFVLPYASKWRKAVRFRILTD
jgi:hypothetical protein